MKDEEGEWNFRAATHRRATTTHRRLSLLLRDFVRKFAPQRIENGQSLEKRKIILKYQRVCI